MNEETNNNVEEKNKDISNNNIKENNTNIQNNNHESKKNNNNNNMKVLVLLIVLTMCLIGLLSYKIFVVDNKNTNKKENNNVVEKNKQEENKNIVEKNKHEKNVKDNNQENSKLEENENKDNDEENKTKVMEFNNIIADYIKNNTFDGLFPIDYDGVFRIDTKSITQEKCNGDSFVLTNNGLNVEAKCVKNMDSRLVTNYAYDLITKNNKTITVNSELSSCGGTSLYSNNNYIIEFHSGCAVNAQSIIIYNINDGEKKYYSSIYFEDSQTDKPYLATASGTYEHPHEKRHGIVFSKNQLYYVLAYPYAIESSSRVAKSKCKLMKIDLSNSDFIENEIGSMDCYYRDGY